MAGKSTWGCVFGKGSLQLYTGTDVVLSLSRSKVGVALLDKPTALSPSGRLEDYFAHKLYSFAQSQESFRFFVKDHQGQYHLHVSMLWCIKIAVHFFPLQIWMLNVCSELMCNSYPELCSLFSGKQNCLTLVFDTNAY